MSAPAPAAPEPLLPHSRAARRPSNTPTLWRFLRRSSALPLSLLASCVHPGSAFVPGGTDDEDDEDDDYDGLWDDTLPAAGITVGFATNFILNPPYPQYAPGGSLQPLLKSDAPTRSKTRLLKPPPLALGPVLGAAPIVARIFTHLPASSVQRLSRVCRMWRQCADCALQKFSVSLCVSWMQGKGASSMHEWSGRLIVENEYCVDDFRSSSLRILQLREWTFGTSSENFMNRNFVEIRNTRKHVAIPVHQIERIRIEFSDSAGISYSRATHYFETASQHPFSNGRAELFAQNCSIVLSPSGNSVERVRVGIASAASTAAENSHHFVSRIRASPTMYSRRRWSELVEYECEARAAFGAGSEFAADVLQAVFETCAMRNYLSCPEHERVLSFTHVIMTLISGPSESGGASGEAVFAAMLADLAAIMRRVESIASTEMPFMQRATRLAECHCSAWRLWMCSLSSAPPAAAGSSSEWRGLNAPEAVPVVGCVALRAFGYRGNLKDHRGVYEFLVGFAERLPSYS